MNIIKTIELKDMARAEIVDATDIESYYLEVTDIPDNDGFWCIFLCNKQLPCKMGIETHSKEFFSASDVLTCLSDEEILKQIDRYRKLFNVKI